jgi:hypothetical protein
MDNTTRLIGLTVCVVLLLLQYWFTRNLFPRLEERYSKTFVAFARVLWILASAALCAGIVNICLDFYTAK